MTEKMLQKELVGKIGLEKNDHIWLMQQGRTLDKLQRMVAIKQKENDLVLRMLEEIEGCLLQNRLTKEPITREEAELYVRVLELGAVDEVALNKAWGELMGE